MSSLRRYWFWLAAVAGSIVGAALSPPVSDLILGLVVLPAMALTVTKARALSGTHGWRMIAMGSVMIGFAPVITEIHRAVEPDIGPLTVGDAVLVAGYLVLITGLSRVLRARTMAVQTRSMLDAALITLWVGFLALAWAGPQMAERLTAYPFMAALLYLPLSLAIIYLLLRLVLGSDSQSPSVLLLAATAVMTVVSELNFLAVAAGYDGARRFGVAAATLALVAVAAAISHPSANEIEMPVAGQQEPLPQARILSLAVSFVAMAISLAVLSWTQPFVVIMLGAIGILTVVNLFVTIQERERLIVVERNLRLSVADILRAERPATILELGGRAADLLLDNKAYLDVDLLGFADGVWQTRPDDRPAPVESDIETALTEALATQSVFRDEQAAELPGAKYTTRLAVPLREGRDHADLLLIEAGPVLTTIEIEQLEQVAAAIDLALVAYELTEKSHQQRSDRRFRALVHDSSDVVTLIDPESCQVTMVSPSLRRILGHPESTFIGGPVLPHLHPEDRNAVEQLLEAALVKPQKAPVDIRLQHTDGHYHWFSAMVRDHTNDAEVGGIVVNFTDINARKMAELSLGFSEQRYRALVLNSKDVFAVLDPDLTINYVSPNVESVLGHSAADLVATNMATLLAEESASTLSDLVDGKTRAMHNETLELTLRTRSGDNRVAEVTVSDRSEGTEAGFLLSISDVTERRRLEHSLRDQALYDDLTGLANRSSLYHELQGMLQRLEEDRSLGLVHIDLDEVKTVTQSIGFQEADQLLIQVATRLRSRLRSDDVLARTGSHEFVIATEGESAEEITRMAERTLRLFDEPFYIADRPHRLGVVVGLDTTDDRATIAGDFLTQANLAAAVQAESGPGVGVFEPALRDDATARFELAGDLEGAVERSELHLVYQPILEIETSKVRDVEALLRWTHPDRGPVSPGVFIPLAEKTGLIINIGRWVLAQACQQLIEWSKTVQGAEHLGVSVNVSAIQLEEPGEAQRLGAVVVDSGIDPSRITIELTESTLIDDPVWIRAQLQELKSLGMRVAVDDFGTGAAGLGHLRDVPFDVIKIDKSYVDTLNESEDARRLVAGVIDLAHKLGAETVAEGIEEPSELELLQTLGCELGQGFYLSRPMEPAQLEEWFARGRAGSAPALIAQTR